MKDRFPDGVWPVMLTPFTEENKVDYHSLEKLVNWYIDQGVSGLFSVCQSSEIFFLSLEERTSISRFVKEVSNGRVPVIASGHISDSREGQAEELNRIAETGADALILISNRIAREDQSGEVFMENLFSLMDMLPEDIPLGFYECPFPYKRLITPEQLKICAETGRFYFLKDTSCDIENIKAKLKAVEGTPLKIYNANTATLLESLKAGVRGYSGVMANIQCDLYVWLTGNFRDEPERADLLNDFLTVSAFIERQVYPVNAKYYQKIIGNFNGIVSRVKKSEDFKAVERSEVEQLMRLTDFFRTNQ